MTEDEAMTILNAFVEIYKSPYQLVQQVLKGICSFSFKYEPGEFFSEDDPPVELDKGMEIIPIDGLLGIYYPNKKKIIIFNKGIQKISDILKVNPEHLKLIVRIHEWAHAILHLGVSENDNLKILKDDSYGAVVMRASTKMYKGIEPALHEALAQILTLYCIQDMKKDAETELGKQALEKIEKTFHILLSHQPSEYQIRDLLGIPRDRICRSIDLVRNRYLAGKVEPWKTVVKL